MPPRTANIDNQSLRGFLGMVERDYPDEIVRIREPVDIRFDITSLVFELERAGRSPVVVYEKVGKARHARRHQHRRQPQAARRLPRAWRRPSCPPHSASAARSTSPARWCTEAAWEEVVIEGDEVDLTKLPIPLHFSVDAAPYITGGPDHRARSRSPASIPPASTA